MNFYLPDFYNKYNLNLTIIYLLQNHPEYFYENIKIGAIYGAFPAMIWNGGRLNLTKEKCSNIEFYINTFNNLEIPLRFTLTNNLISKEHLSDKYCNLIMDIANNGYNEIIINSSILEEYLRKKYPNYKYILSTTKCERKISKINNYCKKYDMVVLDFRDNNNWDLLSQLSSPEKIEILVNATCDPNCKFRELHYSLISKQNLQNSLPQLQYLQSCPSQDITFNKMLSFDSTVTRDLIPNYLTLNIKNFKLEGRNVPIQDNIQNYIYYLIKPEYQKEVEKYLFEILNFN